MSEHFCLKWNNHQTTLVSVFDKLLEHESLVDCTLAADGKFMKAHKVVLSACSPYLEDILRNHEDKHPILIFNDISFNELKAMLEYMYRGEVNVSQEQLNTFLKAAEALKIKGLTDQGGGGSGDGGGQDNLKRKLNAAQNRKTHSPVMGMTPVERPSSPKRRKPVRRQSRDENFPGDSNSCDTAPTPPPSQPQQVNSIAARIEEKVAKIKKESCGAEPPPGGAAALSALGMLQPKTEFIEESGNVEDLTLEEEEEYGPNPGTSQGSFSSQDFNNWPMGDPTSDEVFMASQHDVNNSAGNSQDDRGEFRNNRREDETEKFLAVELPKMMPTSDGEESSYLFGALGEFTLRQLNFQQFIPERTVPGCDFCEYIPCSKEDLKKHVLEVHGDKPYKCNICDYATHLRTLINLHMRKHTGEKPYKCSLCDYSAAQRSNLTKHMRRHTGEKPYKCTICTFSASENAELRDHMRLHSGEKPRKCPFCNYSTTQKSALMSHIRRHTGEKPYKCELCDYRTVQRSTLRCHMRVHSDDKPLTCTYCGYKAVSKSALGIHIRTHTGEKPHECNQCDYSTNQISNLSRHMRMHADDSDHK